MARTRHHPLPPAGPEELECPLCERVLLNASRHHLVPVAEGGRHGATVDVCRSCHDAIHAILDNRTIARDYPSVAALRAHPVLRGTFRFIGRQASQTAVRTRRPRDRRRRR